MGSDPSAFNGWSAAAYAGLQRGELALPYCGSCARFEPPWALFCSHDPQHPLGVRRWDGPATVASWVTYHRDYGIPAPRPVPYVVLLVELADGLRLSSLLAHGSDPAVLRRGDPLDWAPEDIGGTVHPAFAARRPDGS